MNDPLYLILTFDLYGIKIRGGKAVSQFECLNACFYLIEITMRLNVALNCHLYFT